MSLIVFDCGVIDMLFLLCWFSLICFSLFFFFPFFLFFSDIFITYVDDRSVLCPIGVSQLISVSLGCIES